MDGYRWIRVDPGGYGWIRVDTGGYGWIRIDMGEYRTRIMQHKKSGKCMSVEIHVTISVVTKLV